MLVNSLNQGNINTQTCKKCNLYLHTVKFQGEQILLFDPRQGTQIQILGRSAKLDVNNLMFLRFFFSFLSSRL